MSNPFSQVDFVRFDKEFGEDRNGEPAVWIYVIVSDETALGAKDAGARISLRLRIRNALAKAGWSGPVYTRFRRVSEDAAA